MNAVLADLRFAFRVLGKSPGFVAVAVVTLALAIGVNSAVFSLINGLILRPVVPYKPAEVVSVFTAKKESNRDYRQFSFGEYQAIAAAKDTFSDVTAVNFSLAGVARDREPMHRAFIFVVADNFFRFMGVQPAAGRFFSADEGRPNANIQVVVASYGLWQRMGGGADFVGSTVRLNGKPHTVIGIAPEGFSGISGLLAPELWLPLGLHTELNSAFSDSGQVLDLNNPKNYTLNVMARLAPGLTLANVKPRLPVIAERLTSMQPSDAMGTRELQVMTPSRFSISTTPSDDGPLGLMSVLLAGMASIVLLIASLNLINMLLARGAARAREIALRLAIGATRWQIVRQLLVEGLVLSLAGGAVGLLLARSANSLLQQSFAQLLGSMNFSFTTDLRPDATVLAVTIGFCVLATLIFSLGPALKASRADVVNDLKTQGAESTASGRLNRFFAPRHVLVMAQMTLSLVLIFSAGLFFRGALKAGGLDLGFNPNGVVLTEMDFSLANTPQADAMRRIQRVTDRVRALPGVKAVGWSTLVPYGNLTNTVRLVPADCADRQEGRKESAARHQRHKRERDSCLLREHRRARHPRTIVHGAGVPEARYAARLHPGRRHGAPAVPRQGSDRPARASDRGALRWIALRNGGRRHRRAASPRRHGRRRACQPRVLPAGAVVQRGRVAERPLLEQRPGRRAGRAAGSPPRAAAARRRPADPAAVAVHAAPRQERHALDGAARRGDVRHLRRHRAAAGGGRRLRREGVRRRAAHARDRNPAGARRESRATSSR